MPHIKELLELDSGCFQAMSEKVVMPSTQEFKENPGLTPSLSPMDEDEISEHQGSQQTNMFAAMSYWCQLWALHYINTSAGIYLLCSKEQQDNTRQFIVLAGLNNTRQFIVLAGSEVNEENKLIHEVCLLARQLWTEQNAIASYTHWDNLPLTI